jgi:AcrR family transcriptional regulator
MSAATKPRRETPPEARRPAILEAARQVFARHGYAGTTVDHIAEEAGIAKGTVYLYFRSKEEIYLAAVVENVQQLLQLTRERVAAAGTFDEQIREFFRLRLEYVEKHQEFFRIYLAEFGSLSLKARPLPREFEDLFRQGVEFMASIVRAAIQRGDMRQVSPEAAAFTLFDLTRGFIERRLLGWSATTPQEDLQYMVDFVRLGFQVRIR